MPCLFFVDDEEDLVYLVTLELNRRDVEVIGCSDSRQALSLSRTGKFDCAAIDLRMPHYSGFEVARQLLENRPGVPVVLVTGAERDPVDLEQAQRLGLRLLRKPTTMRSFGQALLEAFGYAEPGPEGAEATEHA